MLPFPCFLSSLSMSKKLIAALSLSLVLAACNTTADITTDDLNGSSASSVDAMESSASSDESASSDSSDSSDSSSSSAEGASASVEADTSVETGY